MTYSEFLADRVRQRLAASGALLEKKMMGGLIFMVNDKMCVGVDTDRKTGDDRLMVRVGKNANDELLERPGCREMDFTGKPMKGFLFVYPEGFDGDPDLDFWVEKALAFNRDGAKPSKKAKLGGLLLIATVLFLGCSMGHRASALKTSGNPIFEGWYADPEARIFNKTYWIYPTYSDKYNKQVFFDAFSSPDLVTWTKHTHILDTAAIKWAWRAMWAPSVVEKQGKYYFFFGANDIQNDAEKGGIGVAVADRPQGPFKDYLGKPLVDKFHNGAQPIDQFVFKDINGQYYLLYGGWRHCNVAKLKDDFTGFTPFDDGATFKEITPQGYVEGSFMFYRKGKYYFMWSEGGWTGPDYCVAYAMADSPLGPFNRVGKILQQDPKIATGAGHHSVIQMPGKDAWYIVYHRRPLGQTDGNARQVCIEPMYFDEKGLIKPVVLSKTGVGQKRI